MPAVREGAGDACLLECGCDLLVIAALADALATAPPGGFQHDGVADGVAACHCFLHCVDARLQVQLISTGERLRQRNLVMNL